jgi:hypothetical protein
LRGEHLRDRRLAVARWSGEQYATRRLDAEVAPGFGIFEQVLQLLELRLRVAREDDRVPRVILDSRAILATMIEARDEQRVRQLDTGVRAARLREGFKGS